MAGYSGTPLSTKLGIKEQSVLQVLGDLLPTDLPVHPTPGAIARLPGLVIGAGRR